MKNSGSAQLSIIFFLLLNVKMLTIVDILKFVSRKDCTLGLTEFLNLFYTYEYLKFHAQLS